MFDAKQNTGDGVSKKVQSASTNIYWEEGFRELARLSEKSFVLFIQYPPDFVACSLKNGRFAA